MIKKQHFMIIALIALIAFITMPVQAQTITISTPDATVEKDIIVYYPNGTMYGFYNTTSIIDLDPGLDYIFVLKPQYSNPLDEPSTFLSNMIGWLQTNALALIILAAMGGLFLKRW
jgi:hypothetical protein